MAAKSRKPKLLLVELGGHLFALEEATLLLESQYRISALATCEANADWFQEFPSAPQLRSKCIKFGKGRPLATLKLLALYVLWGLRSNRILLLTGPETHGVVFGYAWLMVHKLLSGRTIINIRNLAAYSRNLDEELARHFPHPFLHRAVRRTYGVTFETKSMSTRYQDLDAAPGCLTSVLYVRHADSYKRFLPASHESRCRRPENNASSLDHKFAVGILGRIDPRRKDYALLCTALMALPWQMRAKLSVWFVTTSHGELPLAGLECLTSMAKLHVNPIPQSEWEMIKAGIASDVFLSPLRKDMGYGVLKGSGTLADAISYRKQLIIPGWADPQREFAGFSSYYNSSTDLEAILMELIAKKLVTATKLAVNFDDFIVSKRRAAFMKDFPP